jgi:RNA polymerase sigma-70 factor, ECF subfamily
MILIQSGDHQAFSHIYDRYANRLKGYFYRMLWLDASLSEDHVHDLFSKLIERPELFKEGNSVRPWLFQIANNMCKNAYRKRGFEKAYLAQLEESIEISSIERIIDEKIISDDLYTYLNQLDEVTRSIFLMKYQQDLSIEELALIFDLPEGTVKSKLFYTRKKLTSKIEMY